MGSLVTGIVAADDGRIADALRDAGLPLGGLVVITGEDASLSAGVPRAHGEIVMGTMGTGTGVPGLTMTTHEPRRS